MRKTRRYKNCVNKNRYRTKHRAMRRKATRRYVAGNKRRATRRRNLLGGGPFGLFFGSNKSVDGNERLVVSNSDSSDHGSDSSDNGSGSSDNGSSSSDNGSGSPDDITVDIIEKTIAKATSSTADDLGPKMRATQEELLDADTKSKAALLAIRTISASSETMKKVDVVKNGFRNNVSKKIKNGARKIIEFIKDPKVAILWVQEKILSKTLPNFFLDLQNEIGPEICRFMKIKYTSLIEINKFNGSKTEMINSINTTIIHDVYNHLITASVLDYLVSRVIISLKIGGALIFDFIKIDNLPIPFVGSNGYFHAADLVGLILLRYVKKQLADELAAIANNPDTDKLTLIMTKYKIKNQSDCISFAKLDPNFISGVKNEISNTAITHTECVLNNSDVIDTKLTQEEQYKQAANNANAANDRVIHVKAQVSSLKRILTGDNVNELTKIDNSISSSLEISIPKYINDSKTKAADIVDKTKKLKCALTKNINKLIAIIKNEYAKDNSQQSTLQTSFGSFCALLEANQGDNPPNICTNIEIRTNYPPLI